MLSLIVPTFGGAIENIRRTIDSFAPISDDTVIIHAKLFDEDTEQLLQLTESVEVTDWNYLFTHGFGSWNNRGTDRAKNPWVCLMGVGETLAEIYDCFHPAIAFGANENMFRICHDNDTNKWKRVWNKYGPCKWSGLIHEEITGGEEGPIIFRMQDTVKTPHKDPFKNEVLKWMKACSYNYNYLRLLNDHGLLGATDRGWLNFVEGSRNHINSWIHFNKEMIEACVSGDREFFFHEVRIAIELHKHPTHINFNPTGTEMSK